MTDNILHSSKSSEWFTPRKHIKMVRKVLGTIDLDPATTKNVNRKIIKATRFYTKKDDGLAQQWVGNVFLNPPYGMIPGKGSSQAVWSGELIREYEAGNVDEAILLTNATPDRKWFHKLWKYYICFCYQRIRFLDGRGVEQSQPTHANCFILFPRKIATITKFIETFGKIGHIVTPRRSEWP